MSVAGHVVDRLPRDAVGRPLDPGRQVIHFTPRIDLDRETAILPRLGATNGILADGLHNATFVQRPRDDARIWRWNPTGPAAGLPSPRDALPVPQQSSGADTLWCIEYPSHDAVKNLVRAPRCLEGRPQRRHAPQRLPPPAIKEPIDQPL